MTDDGVSKIMNKLQPQQLYSNQSSSSWIPTWLWYTGIAVVSIGVLYFGIQYFSDPENIKYWTEKASTAGKRPASGGPPGGGPSDDISLEDIRTSDGTSSAAASAANFVVSLPRRIIDFNRSIINNTAQILNPFNYVGNDSTLAEAERKFKLSQIDGLNNGNNIKMDYFPHTMNNPFDPWYIKWYKTVLWEPSAMKAERKLFLDAYGRHLSEFMGKAQGVSSSVEQLGATEWLPAIGEPGPSNVAGGTLTPNTLELIEGGWKNALTPTGNIPSIKVTQVGTSLTEALASIQTSQHFSGAGSKATGFLDSLHDQWKHVVDTPTHDPGVTDLTHLGEKLLKVRRQLELYDTNTTGIPWRTLAANISAPANTPEGATAIVRAARYLPIAEASWNYSEFSSPVSTPVDISQVTVNPLMSDNVPLGHLSTFFHDVPQIPSADPTVPLGQLWSGTSNSISNVVIPQGIIINPYLTPSSSGASTPPFFDDHFKVWYGSNHDNFNYFEDL